MYERPPAMPPRRTYLLVLYALLFMIGVCLLGYLLLLGFSGSDWSTGAEPASALLALRSA